MRCIDVEKRFARYKIGYDDPQHRGTLDPWHKLVVCRFGHICPSGGSTLWAYVKNGSVAQRIRKGEFSCIDVRQDGSDGLGVEFDVKDWNVVFDLLGAKKR
jgi:hypothetical protein